MGCPSCQSESPFGAKFCVECGNELEIIYPQCKASNLPSFKFCSEYGHQLVKSLKQIAEDISFDEKLNKI